MMLAPVWYSAYSSQVCTSSAVIVCRFLSGHFSVMWMALWLLTCSNMATHFLLQGAVLAVKEITSSWATKTELRQPMKLVAKEKRRFCMQNYEQLPTLEWCVVFCLAVVHCWWEARKDVGIEKFVFILLTLTGYRHQALTFLHCFDALLFRDRKGMHAHTHARTHTHTHTHTHNRFTDSSRDNLGEPVPEETFTHSHLSWSSVIPYLLPLLWSIASSLFCSIYVPDSLFLQSLSKFSLSTSWPGTLIFILHIFLHPIIVFFS